MKPHFLLAIALLSGSLPVVAQQGSGSATASQDPVVNIPKNFTVPPSIMIFAQQAASCPAAFTARHLSDGTMIRTGQAHPKGIGQRLHVTLNAAQGAIATLAVHGFSNKGRVTQADGGNAGDAVQNVTVYLAPAQSGQAGGDLWAPELTAVTSIDLVSLSYDDGTKWSPREGHTCRITPDPLMLISGR